MMHGVDFAMMYHSQSRRTAIIVLKYHSWDVIKISSLLPVHMSEIRHKEADTP